MADVHFNFQGIDIWVLNVHVFCLNASCACKTIILFFEDIGIYENIFRPVFPATFVSLVPFTVILFLWQKRYLEVNFKKMVNQREHSPFL